MRANLPLTVTEKDWNLALAQCAAHGLRCSNCVIAVAINRTYPEMAGTKVGLPATYKTDEQGNDLDGTVYRLSPELLKVRRAFDADYSPKFPGETTGVLFAQ